MNPETPQTQKLDQQPTQTLGTCENDVSHDGSRPHTEHLTCYRFESLPSQQTSQASTGSDSRDGDTGGDRYEFPPPTIAKWVSGRTVSNVALSSELDYWAKRIADDPTLVPVFGPYESPTDIEEQAGAVFDANDETEPETDEELIAGYSESADREDTPDLIANCMDRADFIQPGDDPAKRPICGCKRVNYLHRRNDLCAKYFGSGFDAPNDRSKQ